MSNPEPVTVTVSLDEIRSPKTRSRLQSLVSQYRDLQDQIAALEAGKKSLMSDIRECAEATGAGKIVGDGWSLSEVHSRRESIDPKLLLKKGVAVSVINFATVVKESTYWTVRAMKPGVGEED